MTAISHWLCQNFCLLWWETWLHSWWKPINSHSQNFSVTYCGKKSNFSIESKIIVSQLKIIISINFESTLLLELKQDTLLICLVIQFLSEMIQWYKLLTNGDYWTRISTQRIFSISNWTILLLISDPLFSFLRNVLIYFLKNTCKWILLD